MEAKIKGKWVEYDYSINAFYTINKKIEEQLSDDEKIFKYLGKSKAVRDSNRNIMLLSKRHLFYKVELI